MLSGRRPFDDPDDHVVREAIAFAQPASLKAMRPDIPDELSRLVNDALAKIRTTGLRPQRARGGTRRACTNSMALAGACERDTVLVDPSADGDTAAHRRRRHRTGAAGRRAPADDSRRLRACRATRSWSNAVRHRKSTSHSAAEADAWEIAGASRWNRSTSSAKSVSCCSSAFQSARRITVHGRLARRSTLRPSSASRARCVRPPAALGFTWLSIPENQRYSAWRCRLAAIESPAGPCGGAPPSSALTRIPTRSCSRRRPSEAVGTPVRPDTRLSVGARRHSEQLMPFMVVRECVQQDRLDQMRTAGT